MITHEIEMDMNNQHTRRDFILHSALIAGTGIFAGGSLNKVFGEAMESNIKMPSLKELELFDSCVTLGRFSAENCISSVEQLLSIMDRYVIKEALVQDYHARTVYPLENGNRRLLDMIRNQPRLHPVWVLEPPVQPGRKPAEKLVDNLLNSNVPKECCPGYGKIYLQRWKLIESLVFLILVHRNQRWVHYQMQMWKPCTL
jgi:hypothetical protein